MSSLWLRNGSRTEDIGKYCEGGLCPIELGDRLANRFTVLHKLGYGGFATVWLVRDDDERHGRYVALKVVSASWSQDYEPAAVVNRLRQFERDNGSPGLFVLELEHVFHTSRNGRHLCQVFPVLGPSLASFNTFDDKLYLPFAKSFARQLAKALDTLHSLGIRHGDFMLKNVAIKLDKSLDSLTEEDFEEIFGDPEWESLERYFPDTPSPAPGYAVDTGKLTFLPAEYLSTAICIFDWDQAFFTEDPPRDLAHISPQYLSPEAIFNLNNSPAADIWALGSLPFHLRVPRLLFQDWMARDPESTVLRIYEVFGSLPQEWLAFLFLGGYPVHEPLELGVEYDSLKNVSGLTVPTLEQLVEEIRVPRSPRGTTSGKAGIEKFCLLLPTWELADRGREEERFLARHTVPIQKGDAEPFLDLLRKIFEFDPAKRITARQILEHPWLVDDIDDTHYGEEHDGEEDVEDTGQGSGTGRGEEILQESGTGNQIG
ncbi:kinase-like domain-containing protein [Chaetomium strumarium]|uniref:non-specific serine/threonine protein kinase n=1 Tax=Chaetomium strumarium TaxID=1170767 RepID=A0AAJ0H129_9PEZI|nr:kinase-like domain-containing protein [Chaetomium strumarium]